MEKYKETKVNTKLDKFGLVAVEDALKTYLHRRVMEDYMLLDGFYFNQINNIINETIECYGGEINQFVAVALEKVAKKYLTK